MANIAKLIAVFEEARRLASLPGNDFSWSGWEEASDAQVELDAILGHLRAGSLSSYMDIVFLPTGPLQELSLSSGWGDEFVSLADRYDEALAEEEAPRTFLSALKACDCFSTPLFSGEVRDLGMDERFAEAALSQCPVCGQTWLRYSYVNEAITGSGRWFLGAVESDAGIRAENAKATLEGLEWYFYGGSYYDGKTGKTSGPILL